jgi:hypothetical protein
MVAASIPRIELYQDRIKFPLSHQALQSPNPITSFPACTTWMNDIDQGNVVLIEWMKL